MRTLALLVLLAAPAAALAHGDGEADPNLHVDPSLEDCEVHFAPELTQGAFRRFVREFGTASAFKQMGAPGTLGKLGVSVGVERMQFHVEEHDDAWNDTFSHPDATHELGSDLAFPKLKLRVGAAESTDAGVFFAMNPLANYGWVGVDVKHALLRQAEGLPVTVAVRGAYTKTLFVGDMDMHAASADVSAGHTLWGVLTPYAGVGGDVVLARETAKTVELETEVVPAPHAFAGLEVAVWHVAVGVEGQLGGLNTLQAQVAAVF